MTQTHVELIKSHGAVLLLLAHYFNISLTSAQSLFSITTCQFDQKPVSRVCTHEHKHTYRCDPGGRKGRQLRSRQISPLTLDVSIFK